MVSDGLCDMDMRRVRCESAWRCDDKVLGVFRLDIAGGGTAVLVSQPGSYIRICDAATRITADGNGWISSTPGEE